jgi:tetratricopeptide (TPR) repeat protein
MRRILGKLLLGHWARRAERGNVSAMWQMAELHLLNRQPAEAEMWWRRAAEAGSSGAETRLGAFLYQRGRTAEAETCWRRAAAAGNASALNNLALLAEEAGDHAEAERRLRQAAEAGSPAARASLGALSAQRGETQEAGRRWRRSAEDGDTAAMLRLAAMAISRGDAATGYRWTDQAIAAGDTDALLFKGLACRDAGDDEGARVWLARAARAGNPDAMVHHAAELIRRGRRGRARRWLRRAVGLGVPQAMNDLGSLLHQQGAGPQAERLWEAAAAAENPDGMFNFGCVLYQRGQEPEAQRLWSKAAEAGVVPAMNNLAAVLAQGGDPEEAAVWWRRAAEAGSRTAADNMATMLSRLPRERLDEPGSARLLGQLLACSDEMAMDAVLAGAASVSPGTATSWCRDALACEDPERRTRLLLAIERTVLHAHGDEAQAQCLLTLGGRLAEQELFRDAIAVLERASAVFARLGDVGRQAHCLSRIGLNHEDLGGFQEAVTVFERAAELFHSVGDVRQEVLQRGSIGIVLGRSGHPDQALAMFDTAVALARNGGLAEEEASYLQWTGDTYMTLRRHADAVAAFERALTIHRRRRDHAGCASVLRDLGRAEQAQGHIRRAVERLRAGYGAYAACGDWAAAVAAADEWAAVWRANGRDEQAAAVDRQLIDAATRLGGQEAALVLFAAGRRRREDGHHDAAIAVLDRAREMFIAAGDESGAGTALHEMGLTHLAAGAYGDALARFEAAAAAQMDPAQHAAARWMMGRCLLALGRADEATRGLEELADSVTGGAGVGAMLELARHSRHTGDPAAASAWLARAAEAAEADDTIPAPMLALVAIAMSELAEDGDDDAERRVRLLSEARDLLRGAGQEYAAWTVTVRLGFALADLGDTRAAVRCLRAATDAIAQLSPQDGMAGTVEDPVQLSIVAEHTDDQGLHIDLLIRLGEQHVLLGDHDRATTVLCEGLRRAQDARDMRRQAQLLGLLTTLENEDSDLPRALTSARETLRLAEAAEDRLMMVVALIQTSDLHRRAGELDQALADAHRGLGIVERAPLSVGRPELLHVLCLAERAVGDLPGALAHATEALAIVREEGGAEGGAEASLLGAAGLICADMGRWPDALRHHNAAADVARATGDKVVEAQAIGNRGNVYYQLGDLDQAYADQRLALVMLDELGAGSRRAGPLADLALVLWARGEVEEAQALFEESLRLDAAIGDRRGVAVTLANLGSLAIGAPESARRLYEQARALCRDIGHVKGEAIQLCNLGVTSMMLSRYDRAHSELSEAIRLLATGEPAQRALAHYNRSAAAEAMGDAHGALEDAVAASDLAESVRRELMAPSHRDTFAARLGLEVHDRAIGHAARAGRPSLVWTLMERARSRSLVELLGWGDLPRPAGVAPSLLDRERSLLDEARRLTDALRTAVDGPPRRRSEGRLAAVEEQLRSLWEEMSGQAPEYVALRRGEPLDEVAMGTVMTAGPAAATGLVEFHTVPGEIVVVVMRNGWSEPRCYRVAADASAYVPGLRAEIDAWVGRGRESTPSGPDWRDLAEPLLGPAVAALGEDVELLHLVPHGPLHQLPLHAFTVDGRMLLERYPVAFAPSASVLGRLHALGVREAGPSLVLGYAADGRDRETLEGEADDVAEVLGVRALKGEHAVGAALRSHAEGTEVLHLSCHGWFDQGDPLRSGVLLADGLLSARDIMTMRLSTALAVFSACDTGVSHHRHGDELVGLATSLASAGVRSSLLSLWEVDAEATRTMMRLFYRHVTASPRPTAAAALRQAMLDLRATPGYEHPYFWAGFMLTGSGGPVGAAPSGRG